jgi:hypothetical protein
MTCRFLENFTFGTLIAPVTEEEFRARYWEKAPLRLHRGDSDFYGDLFSLRDFDRAVASGPAYVKIAEAKSKKNVRNQGDTALGLERTLADMREGATLVLDSLHLREAKLGLLCRLLEQELGHYFQTNLYLTPPKGQGFTPHWDNHDVFVLQMVGSKHWRLDKRRSKVPGTNEYMTEQGRELAPDADSFTLNQGDMIYIPRGFIHAAECGSEPSLHITLGLIPQTWSNLLHMAVNAAIQGDEHLLGALPLGFLRGGQEHLVAGTLAALRKIADEKYLDTVIERYRDELVTKFPLDVSGQIEAYFQATELKSGDIVGPRSGIVYRVHPGEDSVRVNFGGRTITFPEFFGEALDFALNTAVYAIRDLPGDLEDSEKVVFIERLMQEGLVVGK